MQLDLETLLPWSAPREIDTRHGPKILRKAEPNEHFWSEWRKDKAALRALGLSCGKSDYTGQWEVCWWQPIGEQVQQQRAAALPASQAADSDYEPPAPAGMAYLPFQRAGVDYARSRTRVLIADEMGLGKTCQAIGTINASAARNVLIVCPASLKLNWKKELARWDTLSRRAYIVPDGKNWSDAPEIVICNYDIVGKHIERIKARHWDCLILDESHYIKNRKAKRTKHVQSIKADQIICLSGTPITSRPIELFTTCEMLDPTGLGSNYFRYAKRYCAAHKTRFGWDMTGASNLGELQRELRERFMIRRTKDQVLTDLPAKRRQVIEIAPNGAAGILAEERAMLAAIDPEADYEEQVEKLRDGKTIRFDEMSTIRKKTAIAKIDYCFDYIDNALEQGPVVLFAHHVEVIAKLRERYPTAAVITGETSQEDRQRAVDDFQAGKTELFIGNIIAAGVGLTLTRSSHVIFTELDWTPANMIQAEDRCHRIGQKNSVLVQHLVFEGSLDAVMAKTLVRKQQVLTAALDGAVTERSPVVYIPREITPTEPPREPRAQLETGEPAVEPEIPELERQILLEELQYLATRCDGAVTIDGQGFNGADSNFGKSLARQNFLSQKQAVMVKKMLLKYRGTQLLVRE